MTSRPLVLAAAILILMLAATEVLTKRSSGSYSSSSSRSSIFDGIFGGGSRSGGRSKGTTLKKAAVIGATAYGTYQLGKLSGRFSDFHGGYSFDEWNGWREADGLLCRNNKDCNWIDPNLYCQDYKLDFKPSALWFGGDATRIIGECACYNGLIWNDWEANCKAASLLDMLDMRDIDTLAAVLSVVAMICFAGLAFLVIRRLRT